MATVAAQAAPWLDVALSKKCLYCERRFSKAEHLKRHQRSHTGERPYRCPSCAKRFARSDVLTRHVKAHNKQAETSTTDRNSSVSEYGETVEDQDMRQRKTLPQPPPLHTSAAQENMEIDPPQPQDRLCSPMKEPDEEPTSEQQVQLSHSPKFLSPQRPQQRLDELVTIAMQQQTPAEINSRTRLAVTTNRSGFYHGSAEESLSSALDPSFLAVNTFQDPPECIMPRGAAMASHNGITYSNEFGQGIDDMAVLPDEIRTWLDLFDQDAQMHENHFPIFDSRFAPDAKVAGEDQLGNQKMQRVGLRGSKSTTDVIPSERFTKVQQCWPTRHAIGARLMPTLWQDICVLAGDNVFTTPGDPHESAGQNFPDGCRRGVDTTARNRLETFFNNMYQVVGACSHKITYGHNGNSEDDAGNVGLSTTRGKSSARIAKARFPPAEIFDMGLDLYFRHFHTLMPFFHIPTFNPTSTPTQLLFMMCLIGLTMIKTKGANTFVQETFPMIMGKIEEELGSHVLRLSASTGEVLGAMASGVLAISLAEILGETVDRERCQRLYTQLIILAQEQRIFSAGDRQSMPECLYEPFSEAETRWKAWSRVESTKRLIICLIICDSWVSSVHHSCPMIRTESLQFLLPCENSLFEAKSAIQWLDACHKGGLIVMPTIAFSLSPHSIDISDLPRPAESFGMQGVLCAIRLRISEDSFRLFSSSPQNAANHSFVPWFELSVDAKARETQSLVLKIVESEPYSNLLSAANPNCMVLWHNMCIMLLADIRIFERAAGCAGAVTAREALQQISVWTQTKAARRAALHAAQTFQFMMNRRVSDGDPFHASHSLFLSGLVLGLYVFMVPLATPQPGAVDSTDSAFELLDKVCWNGIGNEGFNDQSGYSDNPAINFIRHGGSVSLSGAVHEGGYHSARRILLDFAHLLEDVGKWRVGRYTQVLGIMGDALTEVEALVS